MEIVLLAVAIVLILLLIRGLSSGRKGAIGESRVNRKLDRIAGQDYQVVKNVLIETSRGTSQIDQVVVSNRGVFVIETKNYKGWIHGSEKSEYWTQTIYKKKSKFRNPVKQNWAHIYALKEFLSDFGRIEYFPIVVFAGSAELKNVHSNVPVIYGSQLRRVIKNTLSTHTLSDIQVAQIIKKLTTGTLHGHKSNREHIRHVKNISRRRQQNEKDGICPRCGKALVERDGKFGKFLGCSGYPRCRYTKKLSHR